MTHRRTIVATAVFGLAALASTACSGATPADAKGPAGGVGASEGASAGDGFEGEALSVWFPGANQAEIDLVNGQIVPAFEEKTGADIQVTFVDWGDLSPKLNAAFAAGAAPDIFGHGPAAIPDFVVNDRLEILDPYMETWAAGEAEDMATALTTGRVGGDQYLIPLSMQGNLIMYNAEHFVEAGLDPEAPPTTWEEIRAAAEVLTQRDGDTVTRAGLLVPTNPIALQQSFASLLFGAGGSLLTEDGTAAAFDSTEGRKALKYLVGLYTGAEPVSSRLGEDYVNVPPAQQPLVVGDASMAILTAPMMQQVALAAPDMDLRVMPAPTFEGAGSPAMIGGSGPGLVINKDSEVKDLAWAFIEYMISPDVAAAYTKGIGAVPARASAIDSEYVKGSAVVQAFVEQSPNFTPNPNVPGWVAVRDVLGTHLEEAMFGAVDVETALSEAAAEVDALLDANG